MRIFRLFDVLSFSVWIFQGTCLALALPLGLLQTFPCLNGDGEIRTLDPLLARQVLSQLSYAPFFSFIRQPPALPYRLQYSTIGRLSLNLRVRDGYACFP